MTPTESTGLKSDLGLSHISVMPGQTMRVPISVTNTSDVIDGVTAIIDGINPDWVRLEQPLISLFPDASGKLELVFDIPTSCPAGDYLVVVRVVSTIEPDRNGVHDFWLTVGVVVDIAVRLRPEIVTGGKSAAIEATVVNLGNSTTEVVVSALEPTREVDCTVRPAQFVIPQSHDAILDVQVRGPRPWFGQPVARQVIFTAQAGEVIVEKTATFNQKARIPRGVITALTLASIILLWALIFGWVVLQMNKQDTPAKAVASAFNMDGETNVPLANVAGTASGSVRAITTGAGISRMTIEALRLSVDDRGDDTLLSVGSAATSEDGTFLLEALVPGRYKFCFSGDDYSQMCYLEGTTTGTASTAEATIKTLKPKDAVENLDIEFAGEMGNFVGKVDLPPGAGAAAGSSLTVTATQVMERATASGDGPPVFTADVNPEDGTFDFDTDNDGVGELPTPATYLITIAGDDFQTQQFEQTLDAGDSPVLNNVSLAAANSRISGTVSDANGPLGNVTVTARSGEFVARTITPTIGPVGTYVLTDLKTPGTYVLTFERKNFASRSITISMSPGAPVRDVNQVLAGGSGVVTGVAVAAGTNTPLSDLSVTVIVDAFITSTTTLSDGSFRAEGLPVQGDYVVTVSGPGLVGETVSRVANTTGPVDVGRIVLARTTANLSGTVSFAGQPLAGATISVSEGTRPITTTTASSPGGLFVVSGLDPGSYTVTVDSVGLKRHVVLVHLAAGDSTVRNINLLGSTISGKVLLADVGFSGAEVRLSTGLQVVTDADGNYSFSNLRSGNYTVTASHTGLQEEVTVVAPDGGSVSRNIILGSQIAVTVLVNEIPTSDVTITATGPSGTITKTVESDPGSPGRYVFKNLRSGTYALTASKPGLATTSTTVTMKIGEDATKDISMKPILAGTIRSSGVGTAGVTVTLTRASTPARTAPSDASGNYSFLDVAPGTYTLSFTKPGLTPLSTTATMIAGFGATRDVTMGSEISGVVTSSGTNVAGATVTLTQGTTSTPVTTAANGTYVFGNLVAGQYTLSFAKPGLTTLSTTATIVAGSGTTKNVTMGSEISGAVTSSSGALSGVTVTLTQGATSTTATTASNGTYVFGNLVAGQYTMTFVKAGFVTETASVTIVAGSGATKNVAMTLIPVGMINGTASNGSLGLEGVLVTLTGATTQTTTTNSDGLYTFPSVPGGTYTLTFVKVGYIASPSTPIPVTLAAGATATVDIFMEFTG